MAATFVLVHGAWHGGWCWIKVARLLRDATHTVYTPTLTGLGERAHLATPDVDLETHIQDVVAVIESEELRNVVLVGHSYGGMVISGVAARVPNRIGRLVYLDAFIAETGRPQQRRHAAPAPSAVPRAVHQNEARHAAPETSSATPDTKLASSDAR